MMDNNKCHDCEKKIILPVKLGKDSSGKEIVIDFTKAPHVLMAGKDRDEISMGLNAMVMSLAKNVTSEELHLVLYHPQKDVFERCQGLPQLQIPVIHKETQIISELHKTVAELKHRYDIMQSINVKTLHNYNELLKRQKTEQSAGLPYKIIFIGELATLLKDKMWDEVEMDICKIAIKGRAAGIHLVVATQSPTSDVINQLIRCHLPFRIAFRVNNVKESRLILDISDAKKLLGNGDMLVKSSYNTKIVRGQCAIIDS